MANVLPLKIEGGQWKQFQPGDTISAAIAPGSGGGSSGVATLNFGTATNRKAYTFVDVTGLSGLSAGSFLEAFSQAESTADHTVDAVRVDHIVLSCQFLSASSFRIHAHVSRGRTYGDRKVRWKVTG